MNNAGLWSSMSSQMAQLINNLPANAGDTKDPWVGRYPRGGNGNPLQYSWLENSLDRVPWLGYSPWGLKELDMTEYTHTHTHTHSQVIKLWFIEFFFYKFPKVNIFIAYLL